MKPDTIKLLPCPFCGGEPTVSDYQDESLWSHNIVTKTRIGCNECDVSFETEPGYEFEAPEAWNRRASLSDPRPGAGDASGDVVRDAAIELLSYLKLYDFAERDAGGELHDRMYDLTRALSASPAATRGIEGDIGHEETYLLNLLEDDRLTAEDLHRAMNRIRHRQIGHNAPPHLVRQLRSLAVALHAKHYADETPGWQPLDDAEGILSQIDNMTTGLCRLSPPVPAPAPADGEAVAWLYRRGGDAELTLKPSALLRRMGFEQTTLYDNPPAARSEPAAEMVEALNERDQKIVKDWLLATRSHRGGSRLGKLLALRIADDLEADGVTEADIDRLFTATPEAPGAQEETL